jgi:hypothetical protein
MVLMSEDLSSYPQPRPRDWVRVVAEALVELVPVAGGSATTLAGAIVQPKLQKRREAWFQLLADGVQDLMDRVADLELEQMQENDRLVTTILQATEVAARSHQDEKLHALRNACLNAAIPSDLQEEYERAFVRFIDELSPLHLRVLSYLADPTAWFERHGVERRHYMSAARRAPFEAALPDLAADKSLCELLLRDLGQRGLADVEGLSGMVTENSVYAPLATRTGLAVPSLRVAAMGSLLAVDSPAHEVPAPNIRPGRTSRRG